MHETPATSRPVPLAVIIPAVVGDLVNLPDHRRTFAAERCAADDGRQFACLTCRQLLANRYQVEAHQETAPAGCHAVARLCHEHGWEALQ